MKMIARTVATQTILNLKPVDVDQVTRPKYEQLLVMRAIVCLVLKSLETNQ